MSFYYSHSGLNSLDFVQQLHPWGNEYWGPQVCVLHYYWAPHPALDWGTYYWVPQHPDSNQQPAQYWAEQHLEQQAESPGASNHLDVLGKSTLSATAPEFVPSRNSLNDQAELQAEDLPAKDLPAEDLPAEDLPAEDLPAEDLPAEDQPAEDQPAEEQQAELQAELPAEDLPAEEQPAEEQPAEEQPAEDLPAEEQPAEDLPAEDLPAEDQPAEDQQAELQADEQPGEEQPAEEQQAELQAELPAEDLPAEDLPAEEQPAEEQPAEEQPAEDLPAEEQPAEDLPAEDLPAEDQPAEDQQAELQADEQPGEDQQAEEQQGLVASGESLNNESSHHIDDDEDQTTLAGLVKNSLRELSSSPETFDSAVEIVTSVLNCWVTTEELLEELVEEIYTQSIGTPKFTTTAARVCNHLAQHLTFRPSSGSFRQVLLKRCQKEYEERDVAVRGDADTLKTFHTFVIFLAQLYLHLEVKGAKGTVMRANILLNALRDLVMSLLSHPVKTNIDCAGELLQLTGAVLDDAWTAAGKPYMTQLIQRIKDLFLDADCSRNVKLILLELLKLRARNWGRV